MSNIILKNEEKIENLIYEIRGRQIMLDSDLAKLYQVETKRINEAVKNNRITDIYKECSYDYDKNSDITKELYKNVQNKLHYAITGMTAPEIIYNRISSKKNYMGLKPWLSCTK